MTTQKADEKPKKTTTAKKKSEKKKKVKNPDNIFAKSVTITMAGIDAAGRSIAGGGRFIRKHTGTGLKVLGAVALTAGITYGIMYAVAGGEE